MERQTALLLSKRLDQTILSMTGIIKEDLFKGIIVTTIQEWFENNSSVQNLTDEIEMRIKRRMDFLADKLNSQLMEFSEITKTTLIGSNELKSSGVDTERIANTISSQITVMVGMMGTIVVAIISGGSGTALIASGPVGWIIGGILAAAALFIGKEKIEGKAKEIIMTKNIPTFIKGTFKKKIAAQLKNDELRFEEDVYRMLKEQMKPVYEALQNAA